ncbi:MAG: ABC transporter, partial [Betaproteobacteria bacterium HGW-Betaproteobacteria-21]
EFWLVSHGGIEPFDGDLDDYQRYLLDEAKRAREDLKASLKSTKEPVAQPVPVVSAVRKTPEELKRLKRDLGKLEQTILDLQTAKHALEARLTTSLPPQLIGELGRELQKLTDALDTHEENWLLISEQIESAAG